MNLRIVNKGHTFDTMRFFVDGDEVGSALGVTNMHLNKLTPEGVVRVTLTVSILELFQHEEYSDSLWEKLADRVDTDHLKDTLKILEIYLNERKNND